MLDFAWMHSLYNRVAGQSVDNLAALSDDIFWVGQQTQFDHFARAHVGTAALGCPTEPSSVTSKLWFWVAQHFQRWIRHQL
jgi:hypothetical protein